MCKYLKKVCNSCKKCVIIVKCVIIIEICNYCKKFLMVVILSKICVMDKIM